METSLTQGKSKEKWAEPADGCVHAAGSVSSAFAPSGASLAFSSSLAATSASAYKGRLTSLDALESALLKDLRAKWAAPPVDWTAPVLSRCGLFTPARSWLQWTTVRASAS